MNIFAELKGGIVTSSAEATRQAGSRVAQALADDSILALHGDLGAGKTTFVQGLAVGFEIREAVTSPTYSIFNLHRGGRLTLVHLDAYRLEAAEDLDDLMLEDFLAPPFCLAIEWPEKIAPWLPSQTHHFWFRTDENGRHHLSLATE